MQTVGPAYHAYPPARYAGIRVWFGIIDLTADGDAAPSASEAHARASQLQQVINGEKGMGDRFGTLEDNFFALDGSFALFPHAPETVHTGWWSAQQSDGNGVFASPPTLTFQFSQEHASVGFTPVFDDKAMQYCTDFRIQTFAADGTLLTCAHITGNTLAECPVTLVSERYRKVVFTFYKTSRPYRFVKVSQIFFGVIERHNGDSIQSAELLYALSPAMQAAPAHECTVTLLNSDRRYNMVNPAGLYRFLQQGQPLDVEIGVGPRREALEYVHMGRFYYSSSQAQDDALTAQITAHTPFYAMENTTYYQASEEQIPVGQFISHLFEDAGYPLPLRAEAHIRMRPVRKSVGIVSHREAVRLAAQAACCCCTIGRDNTILLYDPALAAPCETLDKNNQCNVPVIATEERVNTVKVSSVSYLETEEKAVCEAEIQVDGTLRQWFPYTSPARRVSVTVTGGTLVQANIYTQAAWLEIAGNGMAQASIRGVALEESETLATAQTLGMEEKAQEKEIRNPAIVPGQEKNVAEWMLKTVHNAFTYQVSERGNPARDVGDSVRIFDAYGENRTALATTIGLKFDGTLSGNMIAQGWIGKG